MEPNDKVNILLVDDQPAKLLSYQAILGSLNENLVLASSGREALERLLRQEFAVILVDVCMPEQDGFELAEMIRSHHRFKETAIIFVSAIQMSDLDLIKGYASGAVDYVSVPIIPEILRAKVGVFVELFRKTRQLEKFNSELEERVMERTSRLGETEEALREANQRKDIFLATLAHELRNPLAPIRSSLDLLYMLLTEKSDAVRCLGVMNRQLAQLTRLIDDLMDLSRINQGKLELRKSSVNASVVILSALETARPTIEAADQELQTIQPDEPMILEADPVRVSQVISNLLLNASKYSERGGTIRFEIGRDDNDVVIRVADTGAGIEASEMSRVFEPFYQVGHGQEAFNSGLGIGLALVRTIVEMHGGEVSIVSDGPGMGSEFTVRLPCISGATAALDTTKTLSRDLEPKKILVVDDNRDAAETLAMLLTSKGHAVEVAHDGHQAIELAGLTRPDVLLLDLGMPGMDGLATAREIRAKDWGGDILLVAMTGWGQIEDRRKTKEAGFDRHYVKPVPFAELEALLAGLEAPTVSPGRAQESN